MIGQLSDTLKVSDNSIFTKNIMEENLFAEFLHPDSIMFLLSIIFSLLVGLLIGWLIHGGRARRYRKEAEAWKKKHDELTAQHNALREEFDLKEADLVLAQREAQEAKEHAAALRAEKAKWQKDLDSALEESVKLQATLGSYQTTIEDLNNQIIGLKAQNSELVAASTASGETAATHAAEHDATLIRLNQLEAKLSALSAESSGGDVEANKRLEALEAKVNALSEENDELKAQLTSQPVGSSDNGNGEDSIFAAAPEKADVDKGETVTLSAVEARSEIIAAAGDKWPKVSEGDKDDLTRIKGVGTFLEKKMNELGIYTYGQLRHFTPYWVERLTAAIEFFPGRIERDDWVGQAARLHDIKSETPEALDPSAVFSKNPENLKVVEGIGPKIEQLLKNSGIADLTELSKAKDSRLRSILEAAGSRYRMHDPTTWPVQAELAVKKEWGKLKELQDKLKGGKEA